MQAEKAGVDRAAVIFAVTCGAKTSAKDVDPEEGQLVLEAIAAISRGEYDLVEKSPGVWSFGDRRQPAQASLDDMGRPFE